MSPLSRRSFLLGTGAAAVLAACGGDDDEATSTTTTAAGPSTTAAPGGDTPILGVTFDRNLLLVSGIPQRAPFVLFEPSGGLLPAADAPAELTFEFEAADGEAPTPVTVARHGDDIERPYYPLLTTFPSTGMHTVRAEVAGATLEQTVNVSEASAIPVPQLGQPLPSAPTPTTADPLGVQTVCTRETPCPFHEVSLEAALAEGRPVALMVSTPAYCQVAICGPVLDLLIDAAPGHPDLAIVHLEVYPNGAPPETTPSPVVTDVLRLGYEPVLFVADATGKLTARLDNIYDGPELDEALATA